MLTSKVKWLNVDLRFDPPHYCGLEIDSRIDSHGRNQFVWVTSKRRKSLSRLH